MNAAKRDGGVSFTHKSADMQVQYFRGWHSGGYLPHSGKQNIFYSSKGWISLRAWWQRRGRFSLECFSEDHEIYAVHDLILSSIYFESVDNA